MGLTDAGITEAQEYAPAADQPPQVLSTPTPPIFVRNGVNQKYPMSTHFEDDGVSPVTYSYTNPLPNGLVLNSGGSLSYDGYAGASVSNHTVTATDAVGSATTDPFDIEVYQVKMSATDIPDFSEVEGTQIDLSQYIVDPNNERTRTEILLGITPLQGDEIITYSSTTEILTLADPGTIIFLEFRVYTGSVYVASNRFSCTITEATTDLIVRADGTGDHTTLSQALIAAAPGNVIEMQADTPGGTWNYTQATSVSNINGQDGLEIRVRVRNGDRVNFYYSASYANIFTITNCSYLVFDGTQGEIYIGDRSLWTTTNGGTSSYVHRRTIEANGIHHVDFKSLHFSGAVGYASLAVGGPALGYAESHHVRFLNCTGRNHGRISPTANSGGADDGMAIAGRNIILEGFDAKHFGGHNAVQIGAAKAVIRNNNFDANWETDAAAGYTDEEWLNCGYRAWGCQLIKNADPGYDLYSSPWGPVLCEGNMTYGSGWNGTVTWNGSKYVPVYNNNASSNARIEAGGAPLIYRYNYDFDNESEDGIVPEELSSTDGTATNFEKRNTCEYHRYYNNTENNNRGWHYFNGSMQSGGYGHQKQYWQNNIVSNGRAGWPARNAGQTDSAMVYRRNANLLQLEGYASQWKGSKYVGNMLHADTFGVKVTNTYKNSLSAARTEWGTDVFPLTNNTNAPNYVDVAAKTKAGFALDTGSNGIGEAEPMTTVTASVTSDMITLDDAYWIYDGFDLGYFGEVGDYIAIYDSDGTSNERIVQVSSVNSETSVTLTASVTVASGDKVWPVLPDGATVCKNIGAAQ